MMQRAIYIFLAVILLSACTKPSQESVTTVKLVPLQIALRVGNVGGVATKGDPAIITEIDQTFRGIDDITLLSFATHGQVGADDQTLFHPAYLSGITNDFWNSAIDGDTYVTGLVVNNNSHLYSNQEAFIPDGTASVLVYGRPPVVGASPEIRQKHLNGALTVHGLAPQQTLRKACDISFDPVLIYSGELPAEASAIAGALNYIASGVTYTALYSYTERGAVKDGSVTVSWNDNIEDTWLRELFQWFTNNGNLTSGTGLSARYMISRLYRILTENYISSNNNDYEHYSSGNQYPAVKRGTTEPLTYADLYNGLRDAIVARIEALYNQEGVLTITGNSISFVSHRLNEYPEEYGLPDGAAVVQWTGVEYKAVSEMLDGVAPIAQYCYPPEIWFFTNTRVSTSTTEKESLYIKENQSWKNDILSHYNSGKVIHSETKSAALDSALQYSCALLKATVRASAAQLDDGDGFNATQVELGSNKFPVTGVIVGSQRSLNFDFTPKEGTDYFLYDNCISGVYLTNTSLENAPSFKTLVSQTPDGDPVYFCLELRNDSGAEFTGADGLVLPGAKFYLVGSIELPQDASYSRAFDQDHTTTVNCLVTSLADARSAIPDLEHPHLSVGLQVNVYWKEATPSYLILY